MARYVIATALAFVVVGCAATPPPRSPSQMTREERMQATLEDLIAQQSWVEKKARPALATCFDHAASLEVRAHACVDVVQVHQSHPGAIDFYAYGCLLPGSSPSPTAVAPLRVQGSCMTYLSRAAATYESPWNEEAIQDAKNMCPGTSVASRFLFDSNELCFEAAKFLEARAPEDKAAIRGAYENSCFDAYYGPGCTRLTERFGVEVDRTAIARKSLDRDRAQHPGYGGSNGSSYAPSPSSIAGTGASPPDSASASSSSNGCSSCGGSCSILQSSCANGQQVSCYQAAACLCQCQLVNGGCGRSTAELSQCAADNQARAQSLASGGTAVGTGSGFSGTPSNTPAGTSPPPSGGCPSGQVLVCGKCATPGSSGSRGACAAW